MNKQQKHRIVCFGDSNTWGYDPATGGRHEDDVRWTGQLQSLLGDGYQVVECGINGRTAAHDDPARDCRNGSKGIGYSMLENSPLDLLIISLGTNDLKFDDCTAGLGRGIRMLLRTVRHSGLLNVMDTSVFRNGKERILLVSPIPLGKNLDVKFPDNMLHGKYGLSLRFAEIYEPICKDWGVEFLDAAQYAEPSEIDCIHMDAENHRKLAEAICRKVMDILGGGDAD